MNQSKKSRRNHSTLRNQLSSFNTKIRKSATYEEKVALRKQLKMVLKRRHKKK